MLEIHSVFWRYNLSFIYMFILTWFFSAVSQQCCTPKFCLSSFIWWGLYSKQMVKFKASIFHLLLFYSFWFLIRKWVSLLLWELSKSMCLWNQVWIVVRTQPNPNDHRIIFLKIQSIRMPFSLRLLLKLRLWSQRDSVSKTKMFVSNRTEFKSYSCNIQDV